VWRPGIKEASSRKTEGPTGKCKHRAEPFNVI
jgi:hypothetical protein